MERGLEKAQVAAMCSYHPFLGIDSLGNGTPQTDRRALRVSTHLNADHSDGIVLPTSLIDGWAGLLFAHLVRS